MNKLDVQKRVLKEGKHLDLNDFNWCEKTNTFSSNIEGLTLDFRDKKYITFNTGDNCTFNTGYNCTFDTTHNCTFNTEFNCTFNTWGDCTFNTGDNCTFKTWGNCTFKTSSNCTFKTSSNCTFKTSSNCVVIRGDIYDVIELKENTITQLYPYDIKGYSVDGICSETGKKVIVADGILSYIKKQKGNVYKVRNYKEKEISYLIKQGDIYSHGKNLKEAKESLKYKISNRDTSQYEHLTLDSILTKDEAIKMYRVVTGACELGVRSFCENNDIKEELTIRDIIELTKGNFGNGRLKEFIDERCR